MDAETVAEKPKRNGQFVAKPKISFAAAKVAMAALIAPNGWAEAHGHCASKAGERTVILSIPIAEGGHQRKRVTFGDLVAVESAEDQE